MAKIISITSVMISIDMDNGELRKVPASALNFVPHVGDEVKIFESADRVIVSRVEKKTAEPQQIPNIVINNTNSNVNTNVNDVDDSADIPKNKWTAFFLCLFLGVFGAHIFFEGKARMGILYLSTRRLVLIGVIMNLIKILAKPNPYYIYI